MSRAFVKEDVDLPERSGRKRSTSGLPPGAINYITARGAKHLREQIEQARTNSDAQRVAELESIIASIHVVDPPETASDSVAFGATVTLDVDGKMETHIIVGVDELDITPDGVSWISPLGKTLLAAELQHRLTLPDGRVAKVVKIAHKI
ncbi:MAG: transcription elongation factor GreB [Verrucomicrobiota bacterium]|jgi:transcription elongation GreA/GreB family factor